MATKHPSLTLLQQKFGDKHFQTETLADDNIAVIVPQAMLAEILQYLHDDPDCDYKQLTDIMGIDYQGHPKQKHRFGLVYPLLSLTHNRRLIIKLLMDQPNLTVPSVTGIYKSAGWAEREAAEMFGFIFEGHPDPRRLLLCDLFDGKHPLRKDYPLTGQGERESFKIISRDMA
ncbi:MAG: NADH-quinone oxidoreductase subunit C [Planctomycetes bacterium]|nr:NADH-quinone oxidoreductase subunit C [Planctomycetota bacterium]